MAECKSSADCYQYRGGRRAINCGLQLLVVSYAIIRENILPCRLTIFICFADHATWLLSSGIAFKKLQVLNHDIGWTTWCWAHVLAIGLFVQWHLETFRFIGICAYACSQTFIRGPWLCRKLISMRRSSMLIQHHSLYHKFRCSLRMRNTRGFWRNLLCVMFHTLIFVTGLLVPMYK